MEILGKHLQIILNGDDEEFKLVDKHYKFIGCDHDLWEFQAIIYKPLNNTYYSVNWYDNYCCNWDELGLLEEIFELIVVIPQNVVMQVFT